MRILDAPGDRARRRLPEESIAARLFHLPRLAAAAFVRPGSRYAACSVVSALAVAWVKRQALAASLGAMFLRPGSGFSALSLLAALMIAGGSVALRRRARGRPARLRAMLRAMFPRRLLWGASARADLGFFLMNSFATGALIGWALVAFSPIAHWTQTTLTGLFGARVPGTMDSRLAEAIQTLAMFLAYDFAYWLNHYLSHEIPALWEFHRVHHTAETLSPVTVYRVHPVDTLVFYNMTVASMALANGAVCYLLGRPGHGFTLDGTNVIELAFIYLTGHLQHSHVWIAFTGVWGKVFASPAHHQIHHSTDPAHFGRNLGNSLAIWDWAFGKLLIPTRQRQVLVFGVEPGGHDPHGVTGALITPFVRSYACVAGGRSR